MLLTNVLQKIKTHFVFSIFSDSRSRIVWKKHGTVEQATDDNTIRLMQFACWVIKATDSHSEYVILIAF